MSPPFDEQALSLDPSALPDDWYGPGTTSMKDLVRRSRAIGWFNATLSDSLQDIVTCKVEVFLERLRELDETLSVPATMDVTFLVGGWKRLHKEHEDLCPYNPWGNQWDGSDRSIFALRSLAEERINSTPHAWQRVGPPLWFRPGSMDVCGRPIIADEEIIRKLDLKPGSNDWTVAWGLLCRAEFCLVAALTWEMAMGFRVLTGPNPFAILIDLYEMGVFPMGWSGDSFTIFVPN